MVSTEHVVRLARDLRALRSVAGGATALRFAWAVARSSRRILAARTLAPADQLMDRTTAFDVDGASVLVPGPYFAGAREMYARRVYFPNPSFRIRPGDTAVDLGANAGLFSIAAAKLGAQVIAVEAQTGFRAEIEKNARLNGCEKQITVVTALIGGGVGVFADPADVLEGSHGIAAPPVISIPELMSKHAIERINFLKCDIEGAEFAIITDDADWLDRVDTIAMEIHPKFGHPQVLKRRLNARGFKTRMTDSELRENERPSDRGGYIFASRR